MFNDLFFQKSCRLRDNVEKYGEVRHRWRNNTAHALCMLDNKGYRHTLRICNTYCFSMATMALGTLLNIALYVNCLSCYRLFSHIICSDYVSKTDWCLISDTGQGASSDNVFDTDLYVILFSFLSLRRRILRCYIDTSHDVMLTASVSE